MFSEKNFEILNTKIVNTDEYMILKNLTKIKHYSDKKSRVLAL